MLQSKARQYIDRMLSAWFTRTSIANALQRAGRAPWQASQCHICRHWQSQTVCDACTSAWRTHDRRCLRCAITIPVEHHDDHCQQCEDQAPEFDRTIAAVDYDGPWPGLLTKLKFHGATALARPLAAMLAERIHQRRASVDLMVPVPLSRQRMSERGYNQSWLLARHLERQLAIPARTDVLTRVQHTQRLMSLTAEERALQIRAAFDVPTHGQAAIEGKHVAIIDDVMTTGATLDACAHTLLLSGARSVSAWVVARTPRPIQDDA